MGNAVKILIIVITVFLGTLIAFFNTNGSAGGAHTIVGDAQTVHHPANGPEEKLHHIGAEETALKAQNDTTPQPKDSPPTTIIAAALPTTATAKQPVESQKIDFPFFVSTNSKRCSSGQPLTTPIEPYHKCPLPGLNNLLYTQINRWYCAFRDGTDLELRDRSCVKKGGSIRGQVLPFRYSSILTVDHEAAQRNASRRASICWSDIASNMQRLPSQCEWKHIPSFYGTPQWWAARAFIDFHARYYVVAEMLVKRVFGDAPFLAVHLRRGDYYSHCKIIVGRHEPRWISFRQTPSLVLTTGDVDKADASLRSCYPTAADVRDGIAAAAAKLGHRKVLIATNDPFEIKDLQTDAVLVARKVEVVLFNDPRLNFTDSLSSGALRDVDATIIEMAMLSMGGFFIFNGYSSFSGTVYEQARIHGRIGEDNANVLIW